MPSILRRRVQATPQQIDNTGTGTTLLTFSDNLVEGGALVVGFSICVNGASARVTVSSSSRKARPSVSKNSLRRRPTARTTTPT